MLLLRLGGKGTNDDVHDDFLFSSSLFLIRVMLTDVAVVLKDNVA